VALLTAINSWSQYVADIVPPRLVANNADLDGRRNMSQMLCAKVLVTTGVSATPGWAASALRLDIDRLMKIVAKAVRSYDEEHLKFLAVLFVDAPVSNLHTSTLELGPRRMDIAHQDSRAFL